MTLLASSPEQFAGFPEMLYKRNEWFIKARYLAIAAFFFFLISTATIIPLNLALPQILILSIVLLLLLLGNFVLAFVLKTFTKLGYHELFRFSLLQISIDLVTLLIIVYITGSIESPFLYLFLFHVIISGLLLPPLYTIIITAATIVCISALSLTEYIGIVPHLQLGGLFTTAQFLSSTYIFAKLITFSFVLIISLVITSVIAHDFREIFASLVKTMHELEESEKQKQRYIIAVVHEIKSPLTAVSSFLRLISNNVLGEIPPAAMERIQRSLQRTDEAVDLINTVLKISRLRLLNEKAEDISDIEKIVGETLEKLKPIIEEKQIEISISRTMGALNTVKGDSFLLSLAISNVIQNAVKYTPACGEVRVDFVSDKKSMVRLKISDNGIGIPKEELSKVFGDFFRAKSAKDLGIEGTGVGLSVVRQIIEQHGGSISLESPSDFGTAERPGTTAIITLPI